MAAEEKEAFLSRWSRLKREAPPKAKALEEQKEVEAQPAPALPPVETLTPESDFAGFMLHTIHARENGCKVIVVDPRFTRTAAKADLYVRHRSGSDVPFLFGVLYHIFKNGWEDKQYIHVPRHHRPRRLLPGDAHRLRRRNLGERAPRILVP